MFRMHRRLTPLVLATLVLAITVCARGRDSVMSTEEIVGEWRKQGTQLPPIQLLITSEGTELRARLRLSGRELFGRARVRGPDLRVTFDSGQGILRGEFASKTLLIVHLEPNGTPYRLQRRP